MTGLRICVAGAGALGGTLATLLAGSGTELSVIARGETLSRIRTHGLVLHDGQKTITAHARADIRAPEAPQDIILLAAKSQQLPALAHNIAHAIGPETVVIPVVNGVPWWLATDPAGPFHTTIAWLDPAGTLRRLIPFRTLVGCVAYAFATTDGPAQYRSARPPQLVLGAADRTNGPSGSRLTALADTLTAADITTRISPDIRRDVWTKLAANLATNPLSVIGDATLAELGAAETTRTVMRDILNEVIAVGEACGIAPLRTAAQLLDTIASSGDHRTSMLQDYRAGRSPELTAIGDVLLSLGAAHHVPVPVSATLVRLTRFLSGKTT